MVVHHARASLLPGRGAANFAFGGDSLLLVRLRPARHFARPRLATDGPLHHSEASRPFPRRLFHRLVWQNPTREF